MGAVDCDTPAGPYDVVDSKVFDGRGNADIIFVILEFVYGVGNVGDAMAGAKDGIGGGLGSFVWSGSRGIGRGWSWGFRWRRPGLSDGFRFGTSDTPAGASGFLGDGETFIAEGKTAERAGSNSDCLVVWS